MIIVWLSLVSALVGAALLWLSGRARTADHFGRATAVDLTTNGNDEYQYQWWVDVDNGGFFAVGDHCQYIYVHPPSDTVIMRDGTSCGDVVWHDTIGELAVWLATSELD